MREITRIQFWVLEDKIKSNSHLNIIRELWYSRDKDGKRYMDNDYRIWMKTEKGKFFADERLCVLLTKE